jgi:hypothetical protein
VDLDRFTWREFVFVACCSFRVLGKSLSRFCCSFDRLGADEPIGGFVMERSRGSNGEEGEQQGWGGAGNRLEVLCYAV